MCVVVNDEVMIAAICTLWAWMFDCSAVHQLSLTQETGSEGPGI